MGGDYSPANEVEGAVLALKNLDDKIVIVLVGDKAKIEAELSKHDYNKDNIEVLHTDQIVTMHDDPTAVLKTKKNSSMAVSLALHAKNEADAVISAGNTGAFLAASTVILGRIKGAIVGMTPSRSSPHSGSLLPWAISTRLSTSRKTRRACVATSWPFAVIVTLRLVRSTSCVESTASSSWIALLKADCETKLRSAARPKCCSSQSARK